MMKLVILSIAAIFVATAAGAATQPPLPNSPPLNYYVELNFLLPEMNVTEPTQVWYNGVVGFQKIAFYDGMDTYLFRSASNSTFGSYFVTPANTKTECQVMTSDSSTFRTAVGAIPDIPTEMYTWAGEETVNGVDCYKYYLNEMIDGTPNNFTYWIAANDSMTPVRMEMVGFNGYLGQLNYDYFVVDFLFTDFNSVTDNDFAVPSMCEPGSPARVEAYVPPPSHVVHRFKPQSHDGMFDDFKAIHGRTYKDDGDEHKARAGIFRDNINKVTRMNTLNADGGRPSALRLAVNHLGDRTPEEVAALRGYRYTGPNSADGLHVASGDALPASVDWLSKGAVSRQKEQGDCGSCWSFSTTGALEGANFINGGGKMVEFSEQFLMDCSFGYDGNMGCGGGEMGPGYEYIKNAGGIPTEEEYPYLENNAYCKKTNMTGSVSAYYNVSVGNNTAMMDAVANVGPIAVAIDASLFSFTFYSGGVYDDPACQSGPDDLDHGVLVIGYGTTSTGEDYYMLKNQWSTSWGAGGYFYFARGDSTNTCGVLTAGVYPVI